MKKSILLIILCVAFLNTVQSQNCDFFDRDSSTIVNGWTEQSGDWYVNNNVLNSPGGSWTYITRDSSTLADGCVSGRAIYGTTGTQFMGLVARYSSDLVNLMFKVQDNNTAGYWDSWFLYVDDINIASQSTSLNFGTDLNFQMEFTGSTVTLRIDPDRDGTWDFDTVLTVSNTSAGLCGAASYSVCTLDEWCYGTSCCTYPDTAGAISGLSAVCQGYGGISYSIAPVTNATSYMWTYTGTGASITGVGESITIDFSSTATSGSLIVSGVNSCHIGAPSDTFNILVDPCSGIVEENDDLFQALPNPSAGQFVLHSAFTGNETFSLSVINTMGQIVYQEEMLTPSMINEHVVDLSAQPNGTYIVRLFNEKRVFNKRILIEH